MKEINARYAESDAFLLNDQRNGHGVCMFIPEQPEDFGGKFDFQDETVFPEAMDIVLTALNSPKGSLLVEGEPGSGKSHLVDDLVFAHGAANNAPAMALSLHIAAGSAEGLKNVNNYIDIFTKKTGNSRALVVLDNLDYLGYRNSSRRLNRAKEFASGVAGIVDELLANPTLVTVGLVHDEEWRSGNWTWQDHDLNMNARRVIDAFAAKRYIFRGILSTAGLVKVVGETWQPNGEGMDDEKIAQYIGKLIYDGKADFFHARHVDPILYGHDPAAAIAQAEAGRNVRKKM